MYVSKYYTCCGAAQYFIIPGQQNPGGFRQSEGYFPFADDLAGQGNDGRKILGPKAQSCKCEQEDRDDESFHIPDLLL